LHRALSDLLQFGDTEAQMTKDYVEQRDGGYYIAGSRVSLDSIVYEFLSGSSAEAIQQAFSTVSLEDVYGAIAFYLANRSKVDEYLTQGEQEYEQMRLAAREKNPLLYRKLEEARRSVQLQKK